MRRYMVNKLEVPVMARLEAKAPTVAKLNPGEVIRAEAPMKAFGGRWLPCTLEDGREGFVHCDNVVDPITFSLKQPTLEVRQAPSAEAAVVETLNSEATFEMWGYSRGEAPEADPSTPIEASPWARVRTPGGREGYIPNDGALGLKALLRDFGGPEPNLLEMAVSVPLALLAAVGIVVPVAALAVMGVTLIFPADLPAGAGIVIPLAAFVLFSDFQPRIARRIARRRDPRRSQGNRR